MMIDADSGSRYYYFYDGLGSVAAYEKLLSQFGEHELVPEIRGMEVKTYQMMAKRYRRQRQTALAVAAYEAVIARFPDDAQIPGIRDAIVETYAGAGDLENALAAVETDIEQCPHRRELLRMITRVAVETARFGDTDTAMDLVDAIFEQNPQGADQLLFGYTTLARVYVHQDKDADAETTVNEAIELFADDPNALAYHLFGVGEEYYYRAEKALLNHDTAKARTDYQKSIDALNSYMTLLSDAHYKNRSMALYVVGLDYWYLKDWYSAAVAFIDSVQADPNHRFADAMYWQIAECYEKLKAAGSVPAEEADGMIEWGYQTVFDNYPDSPVIERAALRLGEINLARGKPVSACLYFNWFLDHAHADDGRIPTVYEMMSIMEGGCR